MTKALMFSAILMGTALAAHAQDDRDNLVNTGAAVGGAVGAVVGAPVAAAAGIVGGLTGAAAPRFRHYVVEERVPSYEWREHSHVVVGDVLPAEGVTLYPVPAEYGVTRYQYTVVDNEPVLVDPATRRIVEIVP